MLTINQKTRVLCAAMLLMPLCLVNYESAYSQEKNFGKIIGIIVDKKTGEPIIGANVMLEGTTRGAATGIDGFYQILKVPEGLYTIVVDYIGYERTRVTNTKVTAGKTTRVDLSLRESAIQAEEVVIEARRIENNELSLLKSRQLALSVSDAISAEAISKSGTGDAASAMVKVTGASVVGGKYVFIRGLGERYSNTSLNNAELPTADPDKKAFHLDLFPSGLLDNISVQKTFTPDKPGSFSGGMVNIITKTYPDNLIFKFSYASSVNSQASFNRRFITYADGGLNIFGSKQGSGLPDIFKDKSVRIPTPLEARNNAEAAYLLDRYTRSFKPHWVPTTKTSPMNQSLSMTLGNNYNIGEKPFGYLFSFNYSRKYSFFDNGKVAKWDLAGSVNDAASLNLRQSLRDQKGTEEVLMGGLATLSFKPHPYHEFGTNFLYSKSGESTSRFMIGQWPDQLTNLNSTYETRSLLYTQRNLRSIQLNGEHKFTQLLNTSSEWNLSFSRNEQNEPDLRYFSNDYYYDEDVQDTLYSISNFLYSRPTRFFRNLNESNIHFNYAISLPVKINSVINNKSKIGFSYLDTERQFRERRFEIQQQLSRHSYQGDPEKYFGQVLDSTFIPGQYYFGTYLKDASERRGNYDGNQRIWAGFVMSEFQIDKFKLIGGARFEQTELNIASHDTTSPIGNLATKDWLPSLSLIYNLEENMNFRLVYGRTLARPTFREMAPYYTYEYIGDYQLIGNPHLKRTLIDNYDFRWEHFVRTGELYALSAFYKVFHNPIERTFDFGTELYSYKNVKKGSVMGVEMEIRKRLDQVASWLKYFAVSSNLSLIRSRVDIPADEFNNYIKPNDPKAKKYRPLFGQSPYIINIELSYENTASNTSVNLAYNLLGPRLSEVLIGAIPDVYEQPRSDLNLNIQQRLWKKITMRFAVRNILNEEVRKSIHFKGKEYITSRYQTGTTYTLGLQYSL